MMDGSAIYQLPGDGYRLLRVGLGVEVLEAELLALHSAIGVDLLDREFEALLEQPAIAGVLAGLRVITPMLTASSGRPRRGRTRRAMEQAENGKPRPKPRSTDGPLVGCVGLIGVG